MLSPKKYINRVRSKYYTLPYCHQKPQLRPDTCQVQSEALALQLSTYPRILIGGRSSLRVGRYQKASGRRVFQRSPGDSPIFKLSMQSHDFYYGIL